MTRYHPLTPSAETPPRHEKGPSRGSKPDTYTWQITSHVCRCCFGRVLMRETFDHRRVYRCSNCGIEKEGRSEAAICACGIKLKTGVDAGLRCVVADNPTPEFPSEVTVVQSTAPSPKSAT